jgi:hypothetical protein
MSPIIKLFNTLLSPSPSRRQKTLRKKLNSYNRNGSISLSRQNLTDEDMQIVADHLLQSNQVSKCRVSVDKTQ